ncbi:nitrous oxide-stimulated promoter family protein [Dielma fastidiosa]|uniref:nitrous oxide-stimulated promoter family protein n=1 Tax=Dielma fastidiosa TaxID=1034346 RepID=UPI000EE18203|nr:nitrous oxide-stimulated promoter family protein [Dielma fastidiosa]HAH93267.1 nitrous oxide-stimulated promoter family protein [Dielma fastidiosa]
MTDAKKRAAEKLVVELMIKSYCKHTHHEKQLCVSCQDLLLYACQRIDYCPFMAVKTFCSSCKVHCYSLEKRSQIRDVMKKSSWRMLFHHPILLLKHGLSSRRRHK